MNFIGAGLAIIGAAIGAGYGNGQVIAKTIECQVNYVQQCLSG